MTSACPSCAARNPDDARFCGQCGTRLQQVCPTCATPFETGQRFCMSCGQGLTATPIPPATPAALPVAERRVASVLFVDLVGFTPLSEVRDAEEVRELLSRYFEQSRRLIGRYGGIVEKFIGDAVMAVWGSPTAHEDDAERAVRAALDVVAGVRMLGGESGLPDLAARAGVVTGEVAVTLGAEAEGMVAGDAVNTASRVQTAARAGTVLVDGATRSATAAAIAYQDAGEHMLKGKAEPMPLYEAQWVKAAVGGAQRVDGLEVAFAGRDRELRLVKELFHASAEESRTRLLAVLGGPGVGKSRLGWEFEKYTDGLAGNVLWHRGRCLAYGEGVAFWALAEMVRMRLGILDGEPAASASEKLAEALEQYLPDPSEREWVAPHLSALLDLGDDHHDGTDTNREELFAAWRLFFERLAEVHPVALIFEDLQWADSGLFDFLDSLLDRSRDHRIFVVVLARPEVEDRRPGFARDHRNATVLFLERLSDEVMGRLVDELVEGLPAEARRQIVERAEGVPLYAIETVRMLMDRELVVAEGDRFVLAADVDLDQLGVPATLQALIAARLDTLPGEERRVVQDASVIGQSFTRQTLAALSGLDDAEVDPMLTTLVRKELLEIQADPRSPERGQYRFVHAMVRTVAYGTLARRDRKARHLAVAGYLEQIMEGDELAPIVVGHLLAAAQAVPSDPDVPSLRTAARDHLVRAARRAARLAAVDEAQRYFERALELSTDPADRAQMAYEAGMMAVRSAHASEALAHFAEAREIHADKGDLDALTSVATAQAWALVELGELEEAYRVAMDAAAALEPAPPTAELAAIIGRICFRTTRHTEALEWFERGLAVAERSEAWDALASALTGRGTALTFLGRSIEGRAVLQASLDVALEHDLLDEALNAYNNLAVTTMTRDLPEAERYAREGLALTRRAGNRYREYWLIGQQLTIALLAGRWDEIEAAAADLAANDDLKSPVMNFIFTPLVTVRARRGSTSDAAAAVTAIDGAEDDPSCWIHLHSQLAAVELARGNAGEASAHGLQAVDFALEAADIADDFWMAWPVAVEAALAAGDQLRAAELLKHLSLRPRGELGPYLKGELARFTAQIDDREGRDPDVHFKDAAALLRDFGAPFALGQTLLEHARWLAHRRPEEAEPLLAEAARCFATLRAVPWLEQVNAARLRVAPPLSSA